VQNAKALLLPTDGNDIALLPHLYELILYTRHAHLDFAA
jgi:hypothetical protein